MMLDFILYVSLYPIAYVRFTRYLRPAKLATESKTISKTLRAIGRTIPQIVDVFMLMVLINSIYALIGNRILPDDIPGISVRLKRFNNLQRESDFSDYFKATQTVYILTTLSNYPGALIPYYESSKLYLLFFYPFLIFTVFIIFPIPVAVVFEAFRK